MTVEPPWLTTEQLGTWRSFMNLVQTLPAALEDQLQADSDLSFLEYYVMALLSDQPDHRLRMSDLAAQANSELSRLSHLVNRLDRRGLLGRQPDPVDRRYTLAVLTDAGLAHLESAAPGHVRRVRELFVDVLDPEELRTLRRCAEKIRGRLDGNVSPEGV